MTVWGGLTPVTTKMREPPRPYLRVRKGKKASLPRHGIYGTPYGVGRGNVALFASSSIVGGAR